MILVFWNYPPNPYVSTGSWSYQFAVMFSDLMLAMEKYLPKGCKCGKLDDSSVHPVSVWVKKRSCNFPLGSLQLIYLWIYHWKISTAPKCSEMISVPWISWIYMSTWMEKSQPRPVEQPVSQTPKKTTPKKTPPSAATGHPGTLRFDGARSAHRRSTKSRSERFRQGGPTEADRAWMWMNMPPFWWQPEIRQVDMRNIPCFS